MDTLYDIMKFFGNSKEICNVNKSSNLT